MTKTKSLFFLSIASLCALSMPVFAEETTEESSDTYVQDHVSVRSRNSNSYKRERMQNMRAREKEEETGITESVPAEFQKASSLISPNQSPFMLAPGKMVQPKFSLASYAFPVNCHWVTSIADNCSSLEMEDGSHWEVSSSDRAILSTWHYSDSLVITPNYSWFSSYDYVISNKNNRTNVKANMWIGPLAYGPYSHWVVDIDYFGGHVYLENQMVWCVDPKDSYVLKEWAVNDHVIFGMNDSWFSTYDHILINVNMDDHVRVKQY